MRLRFRPNYPPGRQPYDPINGMRVGALAGAVAGAIATAVLTPAAAWLIPVGAVLGGVVGYVRERRGLDRG